jgi:ABC-type transport system substrate-binding protein
MGTPPPLRGRLAARLLVGLLAAAFAVGAAGWLPAQSGGKKEEEEETTKPKKKPPVVEEEDDKPAKPRKVIPVVEDDPGPSKPRTHLKPPPETEAQSSLAEALRDAKNPALRALYTDLNTPHDLLTVRGVNDDARLYAIDPLPHYYPGAQPRFKNGYVDVYTYDAEWRRSSTLTKYHSALRVQPYEEVVMDAAEDLLKKEPGRLGLARGEMLKAAETILAAADRYHASAGSTGAHKGEEWGPVGKRLHERLFDVQLQRLKLFREAGDWDGAAAYARTLVQTHPDPEERAAIAAPLVQMIQDGLPGGAKDEQLRVARDRYRMLEDAFGGSQALQPVARGLRAEAKRLLDEAKLEPDKAKARQRMDLAAEICPSLPELAEEMARMVQDHPILRVGVRELPTKMVPEQAVTDADLRAVELMYEGLVKLREEAGVGQGYEPGLCAGAPRLVPLGREFRIARGAAWADGTPVTVGDVKETLRFLKSPRHVGYSPMWGAMVEDAEGGGDAFRLSIRLHQGYLDPLSLMTFKVMPQAVVRQPGADAKPAGSGPFKYIAPADAGDKTVRFLANPAYASREGKLGLPRVKEIHLVPFAGGPDEGEKALKDGRIDVLLDVTAKQVKGLKQAGKVEVRGPMPNRRVYFLAVNHRDARVNGNVALRRALALAIDRQALLDKFFRDEAGSKVHRSLNGPFPAGSWPCEPKKVPAELYNSEEAKAQARKAVEKAGAAIELTVKFPAGDPATAAAVNGLCEAVNAELHLDDNTYVKLKPLPVEPHQLRKDVEGAHEYEAAYYHYDFPSKAYWVAPLFDLGATGINSSNYLGYIDPELQTEFEKAKNHRDFNEVQPTMHRIHRMLVEKMPLVPLWQLDTFLAYRPGVDLKDAAVDPLLIFNDVEKWKLEGKR